MKNKAAYYFKEREMETKAKNKWTIYTGGGVGVAFVSCSRKRVQMMVDSMNK